MLLEGLRKRTGDGIVKKREGNQDLVSTYIMHGTMTVFKDAISFYLPINPLRRVPTCQIRTLE